MAGGAQNGHGDDTISSSVQPIMFPHGSISPLGINDSKVGRTEAKYELVIKWNREKNPLISGPVNPGYGRNHSKSIEHPVGQHPSLTGCCRPAGTVRQC